MKRKFGGVYNVRPYKRGRYQKSGLFGNFGAGLAAAGAYGYGALRGYFGRKNNYSGGQGQGVTSQYDRRTVYVKKSMPRYKRRAWKKFTKKVQSANLKLVGTRTIIRNSTIESSIAGDNNEQALVAAHLYGMDGIIDVGNTCGQKDIATIFANDPELSQLTSKACFCSGIIDITMMNASVATGETYRNETLEVDVYELTFKNSPDATWVGQLFAQGATNTPAINGSLTSIDLGKRGATPWDLPNALSIGGIKIVKKTKYLLSKGQCATYQFRDPRNYQFTRSTIDNLDENFAMRNVTRAFLIIFKGVPNDTPNNVTKVLKVGVTRKYMYKNVQDNSDADNIII